MLWVFWTVVGVVSGVVLVLSVLARRGRKDSKSPRPPLYRIVLALSHGLSYGGLWYAGPQIRRRPRESPPGDASLDYIHEYERTLEGEQGDRSLTEQRPGDSK